MLSQERQSEILRKIAGLVEKSSEKTMRKPGVEAQQIELEMGLSVPEALVGMGIATSLEEGHSFLSGFIAASLAAMATGLQNPGQCFHDLVKFGFLLGLSAGKVREGGN